MHSSFRCGLWLCLVIAVTCCILSGVATFFRRGDAVGLTSNQERHDFGALPAAEAANLSHVFRLENVGELPVTIARIKTSCTCTVVEPRKKVIAPGASTTIPARVDWSDRSGPVEEAIYVYTDRPRLPPFRLTLTGFVAVPCRLYPDTLEFGLLMPTESRTMPVTLSRGSDPRSFRVLEVICDSPDVNVQRLRPQRGKESSKQFDVTVTAPRTAMRLETSVTFVTDLSDDPERVLRVTAQFPGVIQADPPAVLLRAGEKSLEVTKEIKVRSVIGHNDIQGELIWLGEGPSPFSVAQERNGGESVSFRVTFLRRNATSRIVRAGLRASMDEDFLEVPLIGIATDLMND